MPDAEAAAPRHTQNRTQVASESEPCHPPFSLTPALSTSVPVPSHDYRSGPSRHRQHRATMAITCCASAALPLGSTSVYSATSAHHDARAQPLVYAFASSPPEVRWASRACVPDPADASLSLLIIGGPWRVGYPPLKLSFARSCMGAHGAQESVCGGVCMCVCVCVAQQPGIASDLHLYSYSYSY